MPFHTTSAIVCKELQQKAEIELNEVPSKIKDNVKHIRKWLKEQHPNITMDDRWLINFLRVSKYNLDKAKHRIVAFCTCRTVVPEFFSNRDPLLPDIQAVLDRRPVIVLPNTVGPAEPRLAFVCAEFCDPSIVTRTAFSKIFLMMLEILSMEDHNATISGISFVIDLKRLNYRYFFQATPNFLRKMITCIQNVYPLRVKSIYFISTPMFFEAIFTIAKLFIGEKIKERIHFYNKLDDIYNDLPRSVLPSDYGGDLPTLEELSRQWKSKIESYRDWFINDKQFCLDEEEN